MYLILIPDVQRHTITLTRPHHVMADVRGIRLERLAKAWDPLLTLCTEAVVVLDPTAAEVVRWGLGTGTLINKGATSIVSLEVGLVLYLQPFNVCWLGV